MKGPYEIGEPVDYWPTVTSRIRHKLTNGRTSFFGHVAGYTKKRVRIRIQELDQVVAVDVDNLQSRMTVEQKAAWLREMGK